MRLGKWIYNKIISDSLSKRNNSNRFRTPHDKAQVMRLFSEVFGHEAYNQASTSSSVRFTKTHLQIGQSFLTYPVSHDLDCTARNSIAHHSVSYSLTGANLRHLEAIIKCLEMNWMVILVGSSCVGKTSLVRMVSELMNQTLVEFPVNNATDTSDLLGGYNKVEHEKLVLKEITDAISRLYQKLIRSFLGK